MSTTSYILLEAANLSTGENIRVLCPSCRGGATEEVSLSITLCEDGVLRWQCFRTKCSLGQGTVSYSPNIPRTKSATDRPKVKATFEGETMNLRASYAEWIMKHWGIEDPPYWYYTPEMGGRIAMSIRSPKFTHRGWVVRDIKGTALKKALTYIDEGEQGLCWYKTHKDAPTLIVEDIPSAVRASKYLNTCALLGTGIGLDRAVEIADNSTSVIVALDQDATSQSFRLAKKYSLLWGDVKVLPIKKDFKDMTEDEICQILQ